MKTSRALRYRLLQASRALLGRGGAGLRMPLGALAVATLAVLGLVELGAALGADATPAVVGERAFRLGLLQALVLCYTTFEVLFRARDAARLRGLPLPGAARFDELTVSALVLHLPLLLPSVAWASALPDAREASFALAYGAIQYTVGVPLALSLHLAAGRTLSRPEAAEGLKKLLAGSVLPSDAALLVYAPAAAFALLAFGGVLLEIPLHKAAQSASPGALLAFCAAAALVGGLAWRKGRAIAAADLHRILPRFAEADVPPPYRDDGVARRVRGAWATSLLPVAARPHFLRDLRQLRRRYRLDGLLIAAAPLIAWGVTDTLADALELFALTLVLGLTAGFRLVGRELAAPALDIALPARPPAAWLGRTVACALDPLLLALGVAVGALAATGEAEVAGLALAVGVGGGLAWVLLVGAVAHTRTAETAGLAATLMRVAAMAAVFWSGGSP